MGLLSEVWKLSPWHIQWGGAERNAFLYRFVYLHMTSSWGGAHTISQSCVCVCMCVYVVVSWIMFQLDFTCHYVLSSLYCWQSPFDRTGATFVYACVGMCAHVSAYEFLGA